MEKIVIDGGVKLSGKVEISGMKNAAVAVIFATVAVNDVCVIENLPQISDVKLSLEMLRSIGARIKIVGKNAVEIDTRDLKNVAAPIAIARKMRASYYLAGASLARFGRTKVGLPGGCDFGSRPIDQHIKAFEALGAEVSIDGGYLEAETERGIHSANIFFDCVTVGATINTILASVLADGMTVIDNAAREPHVVDLANFLNYCGANITGAGTDVIKIKGVSRLHGCTYAIIPDMIEAGTFMAAAAATGGRLYINNIIPKHLEAITAKICEMGAEVEELDEAIIVSRKEPLCRANVKTLPYPGFPTDMNPQIAVLMCMANGVSQITETIWDGRFRYVDELRRMGAKIKVDGKQATIEGGENFSPANVRAVDLRAGAAMILAGLVCNGRTEIEDIHYIERGYDNIVSKLRLVGARIRKINIPDDIIESKSV
ncbi:MAG: UDP-N-acetylglucosamine 1-carboxyvinyltransferase [Clostridia bacterium]|nr:UDP-N-acetylglucosamine 1-carboxyvinyltransferase [Clostridia bacterium]